MQTMKQFEVIIIIIMIVARPCRSSYSWSNPKRGRIRLDGR